MVLPGETPVGAWCKVYVDGYDVPIYDSVSFDEYAGKKRDGSLNSTWAGQPGTMIRKVAVVHALREAYPEDFQGLYDVGGETTDSLLRTRRPDILIVLMESFGSPFVESLGGAPVDAKL